MSSNQLPSDGPFWSLTVGGFLSLQIKEIKWKTNIPYKEYNKLGKVKECYSSSFEGGNAI